jgi:hypothetical protein
MLDLHGISYGYIESIVTPLISLELGSISGVRAAYNLQ